VLSYLDAFLNTFPLSNIRERRTTPLRKSPAEIRVAEHHIQKEPGFKTDRGRRGRKRGKTKRKMILRRRTDKKPPETHCLKGERNESPAYTGAKSRRKGEKKGHEGKIPNDIYDGKA